MSRASLTLLVSLSLGVGLMACGDDPSPGGGGETDTDATTGPTVGPNTDTLTTDGSTTDGPTTDTQTPGSSSTTDATDPDTGSETTEGTVGETEGETEGVVPSERDYRVNSINLLDPPVFFELIPGSPLNVTAAANTGLNDSLTTDEDADGDLDLGFVVRFQPLDQADGASEAFQFANATCTAPEDSSTCDILPDTTLFDSTYTSSSGECYAADAGNLSPDGTEPTPTAGPCFSADFDSFTIQAGLFALPLTDATIAATYVGNPAGNLVGGNIEGFVSTADAANIMVDFMDQEIPLVDLLRVEDQDGEGWVFHLSFTAVATDWTGA